MGMQEADDEAQPRAGGAVGGRGAKQRLQLRCDPGFALDLSQVGYMGVATVAVDVRALGNCICQHFCSSFLG